MAKKRAVTETDSAYFLKVLVYFVFGVIWLKVNGYFVLPLGLVAGLFLTRHDHFAIDRKVEYAVLIVAAMVGLAGAALPINIIT